MFKRGQVLIQKYGGSSVESVERIKNAALRIAEKARKGYPMVVVVSAMGDTTDELIGLIHKISTFPKRIELDQIMATGEMVSASLMASALTEIGIRARSFNAFNLQLYSEICDNEYSITKIGGLKILEEFLQPASVAVVAGFQGITKDGDLATLGRGGSDLTAVIMARELGQKLCEKFTDEDGVYTADPRIVPTAQKVWHLDYNEMLTLAAFGNGILHPRAISCAKESDIRIHVRSSFSNVEGSVIGPEGDKSLPVKSITCSNKFVYAKIFGLAFEKAKRLAADKKPFKTQLVEASEGSLVFGFERQEAFEAMSYCWEKAAEFGALDVESFANLTTITLVGCGLEKDSFQSDNFVKQLNEFDALVKGRSEMRFSLAVFKEQLSDKLSKLHSLLCTT